MSKRFQKKPKVQVSQEESVQSADQSTSPKLLSQEEGFTDVKSADIGQENSDHNRERDQQLDVQETQSIEDDELQKELKRFLVPKIRSASYRWSERSKAIKNARVARGLYKCAICGNDKLKNGEFLMDHKDPVVPFEGWNGKDWTQYIQRMFVKAEQFQCLCKMCHDIKTDSEIQIRKMYRNKKQK